MSQVTESRARPTVQPNIQDAFLNNARRDRVPVTIISWTAGYFEARIKNFDKFVVVFDVDGRDHMASSTPLRPSRHLSPDSFPRVVDRARQRRLR